jgi:hypothetical protein
MMNPGLFFYDLELTSGDLMFYRQREAKIILERGGEAGLTGSNYLWVVTQSVVGDPKV